MKIIIAGSREIIDYNRVSLAILKACEEKNWDITEVVSGGAKGVDHLGELWAKDHNIKIVQFIPTWVLFDSGIKRVDKSAGFKRNFQMAKYADALIAIWDGRSHGTQHMVNVMKDMQKPFHVTFM